MNEDFEVTLIGTLPPLKGLSPYCQELLKALSRKVSVEFIGFKKLYLNFLYPGGSEVKDSSYTLPEFKNAKIRNILTYYNPLSWIWAGLTAKGKVIHAQWWSHVLAPAFFTTLFFSRLRKKRIVITIHNIIPHENNKINQFLNQSILSFGDKIIVHTKKNKEQLSEIYKIKEDEISIIPHGILQPVPIKGISKKEAREHLNIPKSKKVVLYFGNIRDYKGVDVLLKSFSKVKENLKETVLIIAGQAWSDWDKYEKIIEENNLQKDVIKNLNFIEPSEVEYHFAASDIVVLPYKHFEAQSGVGALALPFHKPLVVTNVGGLPDFVKDKRTIAESNDPDDLAECIIKILKDERLLKKMSTDSEELTKIFSWDKIAEKTTNLYSEMVE